MKKLVLIIIFSLFSLPTLADSCGEGDINIDFSKLGSKGKTVEGYIKVIDAKTLKIKESKDDQHPAPMDVTGVVSRKAVCVGDLYCFVARRFINDKNNLDFRWEPFRKDNPDAKGGTQSRVFAPASFEKSTITSLNAPMLISRNPSVFAQRRELMTMEFSRQTDGIQTSFTVAIREGKIEIRGSGRDGAPRIDLNLNNASQAKKVEMTPAAKKILFQPYEQEAFEREDNDAHDNVTKKRLKLTKLKPIDKIILNCLREPAESREDVLKPKIKAGGASAKR